MLRKMEEVLKKKSLFIELKCELDMHSAGDLVMCLGDFNLMDFMEGMAYVRGILKEECY